MTTYTRKVECFFDKDLFDLIKNPNFLEDEDIYTVQEFIEMCEDGTLIDSDGFGSPIKNGYLDPGHFIIPSRREMIPADVTHIE